MPDKVSRVKEEVTEDVSGVWLGQLVMEEEKPAWEKEVEDKFHFEYGDFKVP